MCPASYRWLRSGWSQAGRGSTRHPAPVRGVPPYDPHDDSEGTPSVTEATRPERIAPGDSRTVDLDGPVHYIDFGGPDDGRTVVLVHGLGGSHLNWDLLAPLLRPHV